MYSHDRRLLLVFETRKLDFTHQNIYYFVILQLPFDFFLRHPKLRLKFSAYKCMRLVFSRKNFRASCNKQDIIGRSVTCLNSYTLYIVCFKVPQRAMATQGAGWCFQNSTPTGKILCGRYEEQSLQEQLYRTRDCVIQGSL